MNKLAPEAGITQDKNRGKHGSVEKEFSWAHND